MQDITFCISKNCLTIKKVHHNKFQVGKTSKSYNNQPCEHVYCIVIMKQEKLYKCVFKS
jgi:hypothetical protein